MIKKLFQQCIVVATVIASSLSLNSCSKKEVLNIPSSESSGKIQFMVGANARGGLSIKNTMGAKVNLATEPTSVLVNATSISIQYSDAGGNLYTATATLRGFNGSYISDPISIKTGTYSLDRFLVINDNAPNASENVIAATPTKGTSTANYVQRPLSQTLTVNADVTSNTTMEVVSTSGLSPQDFGYQSFRLNEIKLFGFLLNVEAYDPTIDNNLGGYNSIIGVNVSISRIGSLLSNTLTTKTTTLFNLPYGTSDGSDIMTLQLSKVGYQSKTITKTVAELSDYFEPKNGGKGALVVILEATRGAQVSTLAGNGIASSVDGAGTAASFNMPYGVAVDNLGNVYVADNRANKIRKITPAGVVTTLAGNGSASSVDGTGAAASFNSPTGIAVDALGNVYVSDYNGNKIRKITPAGVVSTLAGSGNPNSVDGTGSSASFNGPFQIALDNVGNLYVAEYRANKIRKITPAGVVSTLAGSGTASDIDGTGTAASFNGPTGIAVDYLGNVYVSETLGRKIRKITSTSIVSTIAGSGVNGASDGSSSVASFSWPTNIAVDNALNLYVADADNNKIRQVSATGIVSTLAGTGVEGAVNGPINTAQFNNPIGIAIDNAGNLYIGDGLNNMIRKISNR